MSSDSEKASSPSPRTSSIRSISNSHQSKEQDVSVHDHIGEQERHGENGVLSEPVPAILKTTISKTAASIKTTGTNNPDFEVDWDDDKDPMNPHNWPMWYKGLTIGFISWSTWCVVVYSTSYTTGLAEMGRDFHISSEPVVTLGVTSYRKCVHHEENWHLLRSCQSLVLLLGV